MHLASPDLCGRVGECLENHSPPAVYADDAVRALDQAGVAKGVILSCAYLYGLKSLNLSDGEITRLSRMENEFTAREVRKFPSRLIGFLSVDPLQSSALDELNHWKDDTTFRGLKLHFTASSVDLHQPDQREKVSAILAAAAARRLPLVIHIGGGSFGPEQAELFITQVLPSAKGSWVQIAHGAGGLPLERDNHVQVLRVFADHIARQDPATEHILFDLSFVPAPGEDSAAVAALRIEIRRIGVKRFLFGSDFNVEFPLPAIDRLKLLDLNAAEFSTIQSNCAPWAC